MKIKASILLFPLLMSLIGCSTRVSTHHGYGHHGHVSLGVHGSKSDGAVVGALIVGGIIGSILTDAKNKEEAAMNQKVQADNSSQSSELVGGYSIQQDNQVDYGNTAATREVNTQWYQVGKDGNCYLMGIDKGVTDVISAVSSKLCQSPEG